jgi:hypothetical protein
VQACSSNVGVHTARWIIGGDDAKLEEFRDQGL